MLYKLKPKGYEYRGVRLGDKCIYNGKETIVIGFDEDDKCEFIAVLYDSSIDEIRDSMATIIMDGYERNDYYWVQKLSLEFIKECTTNQPISLVHIADVLEDVIHEDEIIDVEKIKLCIESLRGIVN